MLYRDALIQAIEYWNSNPIEDEWFFEKFRNDFVDPMSESEAFLKINETIDFLINENDESTACEILQTIINLARKSQTTEMPNSLEKNIVTIKRQFLPRGEYSQAKLNELFRFYRVPIKE